MFGAAPVPFVPVLTFGSSPAHDPYGDDRQISRLAVEMAEAAKRREARAALDASKARMSKSWGAWLKRTRIPSERVAG
jgi:hypothetical protein